MLLAQLRHQTADAHRRLETRIDLFARDWDETMYRRLLVAFYTFLRPQEERLLVIENRLPPEIDWPRRRKLPLLESDLTALGLAASDRARLPLAPPLPLATVGEALGYLYVIEGSTLGAQVITRFFRERLPLLPETALNYFRGYGADTGLNWQRFKKVAETIAQSRPEEVPRALVTAPRVFSQLESWLSSQLDSSPAMADNASI